LKKLKKTLITFGTGQNSSTSHRISTYSQRVLVDLPFHTKLDSKT